MNPIISLLIAWIVTTVSLIIISKLPLGIEIDTFKKALVSAAVFGILNGVLQLLFTLPNLLTFGLFFGLFSFIINIIAFGLAAKLVVGFRLNWGIWSAVIGAIALSVINSLIFQLIARL
ncbi:MAG: phage holin family protein [Desertifilum sp. SIO1I2]|nr:phage holin family protein [Desertifilum sp. SIO1I2]